MTVDAGRHLIALGGGRSNDVNFPTGAREILGEASPALSTN